MSSLINRDTSRTISRWSLVLAIGTALTAAGWAQTTPRVSFKPAPRTTYTGSGPGIIPIGSAMSYGGTNSPDTYTANTTFSSTPVIVDNGKVKIWQEQVPTGPTSEWDVFYMETVDGGPLAGDINANWNILISYDLSQAADFDQVANQWLVSGTPVAITGNIGSICCISATNPILPGPAYYKSGFNGLLPAGVQSNWQQTLVDPYNFISSGGIDPSTANEFVFALHFTLQGPTVNGVVSASAFGAFPDFAPGSWIEIYGTNLAAAVANWQASDFNGNTAPTAVGGTTVTIGGIPAFIDYVSPLQVNAQVPRGVPSGTQNLIVTTGVGPSAPFPVTVTDVEPGLLAPPTFKIGSTQYVVAQFSDGTYVMAPNVLSGITATRALPGDEIVIYGVGFGDVTPDIPPGQIAGETNSVADSISFAIGGAPAQLVYYGLAPGYVGLYQFNLIVPSIPANDSTSLTFSLNGVPGTQTLAISIGN